jgi:tetratricopeptide (TPR) repeat protein
MTAKGLCIETKGNEDIMNCENLRKLLDQSNELAESNIWGPKAFAINMRIWGADNNNFTACTRLANYYKIDDNIPDAKKMYLKALEIYPNNYGVKNNLYEIERLQEKTKFIEKMTTSNECYNSGRKLTQKGHHWLASKCFFKAYGIEPLLKYGVSLAKSYNKLGKYEKIKKLFNDLMDRNTTLDIIEDIKVEFVELLKYREFEHKKVYTA